MKRMTIYLLYDKESKIDQYIIYMLKKLRTCSSYIMVVCNFQNLSTTNEVAHYADEVVYRDNVGYDAGGFKDALCKYIGWENLYDYDELIMLNDSFYGPFRSMENIFNEMQDQRYDFWGLTQHGYKENKEEIIFEHIQTFFLAIEKRMFCSKEFRDYWENMPYYEKFNDVVSEHEMVFTRHFSNLGYQYGCLANMLPNDSTNNINNYTQYGFLQFELITKRNFPFLKKKPFVFESLDLNTQENFKLALNFIQKNTQYDVDLIWENLIRTVDMLDLQKSLHLEYIIPCKEKGEYRFIENAAVVIITDYVESVEYIHDYIKLLTDLINVKIYSNSENIAKEYGRWGYYCFVLKSDNILEEIIDELAQYTYICILHDCDMSSDKEPSCTGKSQFYNTWHNLLANHQYINNIIEQFRCESKLGALTPQIPNFARLFGRAVREWDIYYEDIAMFIDDHGIHCQKSKEKMPLSVSNSVWIRGNLLKKIFEYDLFNKPYLPFMWSYIAQSEGYYVGIVESDEYASMNEINQQYYLDKLIVQVRKYYGEVNTFLDLQKHIFQGKLNEFCSQHNRIYIYGTGYKAKLYQDMIPEVEAYIVSDGQCKETNINGKAVIYLSELKEKKSGIIVCLNEENQRQVIPILKKEGYCYLCI